MVADCIVQVETRGPAMFGFRPGPPLWNSVSFGVGPWAGDH